MCGFLVPRIVDLKRLKSWRLEILHSRVSLPRLGKGLLESSKRLFVHFKGIFQDVFSEFIPLMVCYWPSGVYGTLGTFAAFDPISAETESRVAWRREASGSMELYVPSRR